MDSRALRKNRHLLTSSPLAFSFSAIINATTTENQRTYDIRVRVFKLLTASDRGSGVRNSSFLGLTENTYPDILLFLVLTENTYSDILLFLVLT